jgi:hypothetical protein
MNRQYDYLQPVPYETLLLDRLRELYVSHAPMPSRAGAPLTVGRFYRLYRAIQAEGYGRHAVTQAASVRRRDAPDADGTIDTQQS